MRSGEPSTAATRTLATRHLTSRSPPVPVVLDRYRLQHRLGAGAFGTVWMARDERLERDVAVKILARERTRSHPPGRFEREARAAARLSHPAIVTLYEAAVDDEGAYLVSELVRGETLDALLAQGRLSDRDIVAIGVALCDALQHAHDHGVVHRDVKPSNVLVPDAPPAPGQVAKLTDFGVAHVIGGDSLTRTGDVLGTLAYMAPEQSDGRKVGEPADLYSLALVMYEALSGVQPVRGATPAETVRRIGRPLPSLARARRDLSRELTRAVDRALSASPQARGTLEQLRQAFEQELARIRPASERDDRRELTPTRLLARRRDPHTLVPSDHGGADLHRPAAHDREDARAGGERGGELADAAGPGAPALESAPALAPAQLLRGQRASRRGLPRVLWLAVAVAFAVWQLAGGHPGTALLALVALLPIVVLPIGRRDRPGTGGWLLCALAPALGLIGLAAAFPAVAGQAARWRMRAALGALGYWWLVLAEPLTAQRLWLGAPAGAPPRAAWEGSLQQAAAHVVWPLLSLSVLLGALLWAAAAALLPLLVRGRGAALDVVAVTVWTAALIAVTSRLDSSLATGAAAATPRGLALGAVLGGVFAVAARALRGPV
ncbi:MAG TPA: serine/threonine-protein kinase [Solirubrobacteraceae bacterium]|nr:serine/threonine-protein kinase [Solirubrobacteraceae bacterium]